MGMPPAISLTLEDYLKTDYQPDREYIDGEIVERHLGEYEHANLQRALIMWFGNRQREWKIRVLPEQRLRVSPTRFRIPDVTVLWRDQPIEPVFTRPPLLVIEVLSPEDTLRSYQQRIDDYLNFGIPHIWILDSALEKAWTATRGQLTEASGKLAVPDSEIYLPIPEIFQDE
jgi:Uma2 family endonuclease